LTISLPKTRYFRSDATGNRSPDRPTAVAAHRAGAGIGYVELVSGDTPTELRAIVRKLADRQLALNG